MLCASDGILLDICFVFIIIIVELKACIYCISYNILEMTTKYLLLQTNDVAINNVLLCVLCASLFHFQTSLFVTAAVSQAMKSTLQIMAHICSTFCVI